MRVAEGETLTKILKDKGMPTPRIFLFWRARYEELAKVYAESRVVQGHGYFDRIIELADQVTRKVDDGGIDPRKAQTAISAFQWVAGRLVPQEYGDKGQKTPAIAIQINTTLGVDEGNVKAEEGSYIIEITSAQAVENEKTRRTEQE